MKRIVITAIIFFFILLIVFFWWEAGKQPVDRSDTSRKTFVISPRENIRDIGNSLKKEGFIRDPIVFFLTVKQLSLDGKIQAGNFRLSPSMGLDEIAETLTHGTVDNWVTITEGKRADEIADTFAQKLPTYSESWRSKLITQEGYLFPDTYLFPTDATIDQVIQIMKSNFEKKYTEAQKSQTSKLSREQAVIIASIVEREGKSPDEMKLVASVLENRLNLGMALQADATVQYALGYQPVEKSWWKNSLTAQDLKIDSPYNTYANPGLPPTPISNPGLNSLTAALNPASTNYLYYFTDPKGITHFATTLDEQNANIRKYGD